MQMNINCKQLHMPVIGYPKMRFSGLSSRRTRESFDSRTVGLVDCNLVSNASRVLSPMQRTYCASRREML